jgi:hypothetical protein
MNKVAPPHRWFAAWRGAARPPQVDPADLGTAFGLDLSLNELIHEPVAPAPAEQKAGWVHRLAGRRKPSA